MDLPIYLDHAATTPMRREVLEAIFPYFQTTFGNPSSVHGAGKEAAEALAWSRETVASVLGCLPGEVVFTSGGTEADNLAVTGAAEANHHHGDHVIISSIEHEAVLQSAKELERRGFRISRVPVDSTGLIDPQEVASTVTERTILVSCMYANNEIGTIEPIAEIVAAVRRRNPKVLIHSDGVQAAGALPLDVSDLGVDLLSLSGHKIYGPRGIGALYVRRGVHVQPLLHGGGQELGLRSGTENVAACVGLAAALSLAHDERSEESARLICLRDTFIDGVLRLSNQMHLTGHRTRRLPGHASFYFDGRSGESVLVDLDVRGIMCSSGSACHAGQTDPSHVLLATGLTESQAKNGIRMTLGRETDRADVDFVLKAMAEVVCGQMQESVAPTA